MTGNNVLLDTNVVIDLFKGDQQILAFLEKQQTVYIPSAVLGELYLGAYRSANEQKHLQQIASFLLQCTVVNADKTIAERYGKVKAELLRKGKPIPENDIWIAATALQFNLPLYTNDKHFEEVDVLTTVKG
ncbi:MAG: type II toxin-antitoxin system VapC family toxin [Chitinophagaceae bacterium]|nr:type II toxin-antitoxin system VapC family toxin [Chitinophagaceae bacterium]